MMKYAWFFGMSVALSGAALAQVDSGKAKADAMCSECHEKADWAKEDAASIESKIKNIVAGKTQHKKKLTLSPTEIQGIAAYWADTSTKPATSTTEKSTAQATKAAPWSAAVNSPRPETPESAGAPAHTDPALGKAKVDAMCSECHDKADWAEENAASLEARIKSIVAGKTKHKKKLTLSPAEIQGIAAYWTQ